MVELRSITWYERLVIVKVNIIELFLLFYKLLSILYNMFISFFNAVQMIEDFSMVVGEKLVHETMRQIMAARAIHNVFKMTESRLVVSSEAMR